LFIIGGAPSREAKLKQDAKPRSVYSVRRVID
jgi:hypothetical protein